MPTRNMEENLGRGPYRLDPLPRTLWLGRAEEDLARICPNGNRLLLVVKRLPDWSPWRFPLVGERGLQGSGAH